MTFYSNSKRSIYDQWTWALQLMKESSLGGGRWFLNPKKTWNVLHGQEGFHLHSNQQGKGFHKHYHDQANI